MAYTLSKKPKVKYSPSEEKVFRIIRTYAGRKKKLPTTKMVSLDLYGDHAGVPYHADQIVSGSLRSLRKKILTNEEPFRLEKIKVPGQKEVMWGLFKLPSAA